MPVDGCGNHNPSRSSGVYFTSTVAPGICCRLWTEASERARAPFLEPEIRRVDIVSAVLQLYAWGEGESEDGGAEDRPEEQRARFFGALSKLRSLIEQRRVDAIVMVANEHFTNFFLDNFPALCVGIGDHHFGPAEQWLRIEQGRVPSHADLASHLLSATMERPIPRLQVDAENQRGLPTRRCSPIVLDTQA